MCLDIHFTTVSLCMPILIPQKTNVKRIQDKMYISITIRKKFPKSQVLSFFFLHPFKVVRYL